MKKMLPLLLQSQTKGSFLSNSWLWQNTVFPLKIVIKKGFVRECKDFSYFLNRGEAAARKTCEAASAPPEATRVTSDWPHPNWGKGGGWWHFTNSTSQCWLQSNTDKNSQVMTAAILITNLVGLKDISWPVSNLPDYDPHSCSTSAPPKTLPAQNWSLKLQAISIC